ncbi:hypothetical protein ACPCUV_29580 [Streptomyces platensis]|uniref:hypothetical protein n=1 Tax=Streptomyces platensis TaxID=58346 RepID=UPI003C2F4AD5
MSQDADELAQARAYLLSASGPTVANETEALQLLAQIEAEADELSTRALDCVRSPEPDEVAGQRRRRAYMWVRLAELRPEFMESATFAVRTWQDSEAEVIRAAVAAATR